jgi:transposase InsO family protein
MTKYVNIRKFGYLCRPNSDIMQIQAENKLNPLKKYLSPEGKKRLKWMYIIQSECGGNISLAANKIGISRTWLSLIHSAWKRSDQNPRSLEPRSKAPNRTGNRKRINKAIEEKIIETRKAYRSWGKEKISVILKRDYGMQAQPSTVNRYLHKHKLIDPKLSAKNKRAWQRKKEQAELKFKMRPPSILKDHKPGALMEKDMKLVVKPGIPANPVKYRSRENYWYQHTLIDSFTRFRAIGLAEDSTSKTAVAVQVAAEKRLPFAIGSVNADWGGENQGDYSDYLASKRTAQFFSRAGTPTDNPRVERSHLTDELEFYAQGNIYRKFEKQVEATANWEHVYNFIRPHQALGYLTPMEFYRLWKNDPVAAYKIKGKHQAYLKKQSRRLARSRKMKNKEQIEKLMAFIDEKLKNADTNKC